MTDPRRRHRAIVGALWLSAIVIAALVVLINRDATDRTTTAGTIATPTTTAEGDSHEQHLNVSAFDVTLWTEPPPPATQAQTRTVQRPPPPAPIKLQLIAILTESNDDTGPTYKAALYDPNADELSIVGLGDQIGSIEIADVTATSVDLALDGRRQQLTLDDERHAGGRR